MGILFHFYSFLMQSSTRLVLRSAARPLAARFATRAAVAPRFNAGSWRLSTAPRIVSSSNFINFNAKYNKLSLNRSYGSAVANLSEEELTQRLLDVVKNFEKVDPSKVTPESNFMTDLGLDSLDGVEVVMAIEDEFNVEIEDEDAEKIVSIPLALEYLKTKATPM